MEQLFTKPVLKIFQALNSNARLVGGAVRDSLMNAAIGDIDIATPYTPEEVIRLLDKSDIRTVPTGLKHGTVTAVLNGTGYEITTLRKDVRTDGRHADVVYTDSYEEDSHRRDFTINALYMDEHGRIYDYTNGRADIQNKHVRFIGVADERVREDYLRILRYFRFWGKMGHGVKDKAALQACARHKEHLSAISKERKRDELFKILMGSNPPLTLDLMADTGVLDEVLPEAHIEDLKRFLSVNPAATVIERLSVLTGGKVPDLALSNAQKNQLLVFAERPDLTAPPKTLKRLLYDKGQEAFHFYVYRALSQELIDTQTAKTYLSYPTPVFNITGSDLLNLGFKEGLQMKQTLELTKSIWADLDFTANKKLVLNALMTYNKGK